MRKKDERQSLVRQSGVRLHPWRVIFPAMASSNSSAGNGGTWDVLIAGGGVIGSSIAYFLSADEGRTGPGGRGLRVAVVEPDPTYTRASTGLSVGGIRLQFSTPENILLSRYSSDFFREASQRLAVEEVHPDLAYRENGYLFLATERGLATLHRNQELQVELGAEVAVLSPPELQARFPWLEVRDLAGGSLGLSREGWLDPYSLLQAFRRKAQSQGVVYLEDRVVGLEVTGGSVSAALLEAQGRVMTGAVVDAAGPRAAEIARMAGISDLPVHPRKRIVYRVHSRTTLPGCPLVIDPSGVYFRPEGDGYLCGVSPPDEVDADTLDLGVEHELFHEVVWPTLARRVQAFDALKLGFSWAGHYAVNVVDRNAILGPHPDIRNFFFANGFSGHGLQHSPAVGMALAERILHGKYMTLNLSRLGFERFAKGKPVLEDNVV